MTPLDPAVAALLAAAPSVSERAAARPMTAAETRAAFAATWTPPSPDSLPEVGRVLEESIPGPGGALRLRVHFPPGADGSVPVFLWIHGGGWVIGSIDENEISSRAVCRYAGVAVASIEYRLAPEHPHPAAVDDCRVALDWLVAHGAEIGLDPERVAVGGESAGGNLATVLALLARDRGGPRLRALLANCPVYGHPDDGFASYRDLAEGYGMTAASMRFYFDQYVPGADRTLDDPTVLPLRAHDLSGLPPTLVMTAEYDLLRDEGEEFARRLADSGVPTTLSRYDGQIHGYFALYTDLPASDRAHREAGRFLAEHLR